MNNTNKKNQQNYKYIRSNYKNYCGQLISHDLYMVALGKDFHIRFCFIRLGIFRFVSRTNEFNFLSYNVVK